jgi:hypothetical protein
VPMAPTRFARLTPRSRSPRVPMAPTRFARLTPR